MGLASAAPASVVIQFYEDNGDVIAEGSGSIDTGALGGGTPVNINMASSQINPSTGLFQALPNQPSEGRFFSNVLSFSEPYGSGGLTVADLVFGDVFRLELDTGNLLLATNYASSTPLNVSMTFSNTNLSDLGLERGRFESILESGETISFWVDGAPSQIPIPGAFVLMLSGIAGLIALGRRRWQNA